MKNFFKHTGMAAAYLAIFLLAQVQIGIILGIAGGFAMAMGDMADGYEFANAIINYMYENMAIIQIASYAITLPVIGAVMYAYQKDGHLLRGASIQKPKRMLMMWAPVVLGLSIYGVVEAAFSLIPEDTALMQQYIDQSSMLIAGKYPILEFIATVICAPIIEEILFRGLIYKHLKKAMPWVLALFMQGALFGFVHGQLLWMAFTFALGIVMALMVDFFDSLWPAILVHIFFNGSNYIPLYLELNTGGVLIYLGISLAVTICTLLILYLYKRRTENKPALV